MKKSAKLGIVASVAVAAYGMLRLRKRPSGVEYPEWIDENVDLMEDASPKCCVDYGCHMAERFPGVNCELNHRMMRKLYELTGITCDLVLNIKLTEDSESCRALYVETADVSYAVTYYINDHHFTVMKQ